MCGSVSLILFGRGDKKTATLPPNFGKNHYLEGLNHPSRSTPWKYSGATVQDEPHLTIAPHGDGRATCESL
jgi:hypothetical protein